MPRSSTARLSIAGRSLWLCAWLTACVSSSQVVERTPERLELTLGQPDGTRVELSALTGQPTLLFLFATYDEASQLALVPLLQTLEHQRDLRVVAVALQPDAKDFLPMFKRALSIPFALYLDPENQLMQGKTALGQVNAVPAFVALDAQGRIRQILVGVPNTEQLRLLSGAAHAR